MILRLGSSQLARCIALLALVLLGSARCTLAACGVRPQDRITYVNTRPVGCTTNAERLAKGVRAKEYLCEGEQQSRVWRDANTLDLFKNAAPDVPLVIFIHGNKIEPHHAIPTGMMVYRRLVSYATDERPIHFMIFSWPAEKTPGLLSDFREKAARTQPVAWQFAWLVDHTPAETQIGIASYSYGSRVTTGAAHLLAGGKLGRLALPEPSGAKHPFHAVFFAPALDADWLASGHYHGCALTQIDRILMTTNCSDPAMKYYHYVAEYGDPNALGLAGPSCLDAARRQQVTLCNATNAIGGTHALERYICLNNFLAQSWRELTFAPK